MMFFWSKMTRFGPLGLLGESISFVVYYSLFQMLTCMKRNDLGEIGFQEGRYCFFYEILIDWKCMDMSDNFCWNSNCCGKSLKGDGLVFVSPWQLASKMSGQWTKRIGCQCISTFVKGKLVPGHGLEFESALIYRFESSNKVFLTKIVKMTQELTNRCQKRDSTYWGIHEYLTNKKSCSYRCFFNLVMWGPLISCPMTTCSGSHMNLSSYFNAIDHKNLQAGMLWAKMLA